MTGTHTEHVAVGHVAARAADAIRLLNHLTRPGAGGLAEPCDAAEVIADLAAMTWRLPQLLGQLARWLEGELQNGSLRVDELSPLPDPDEAVLTLTQSLQHASESLRSTAEELDTAHQHAAHLAATPARGRSQNSCRSVGPSHLTKRTRLRHAIVCQVVVPSREGRRSGLDP
jgi:hypothetical protein